MRAKVKTPAAAAEPPTLIVDNEKAAVPAVQNEAQPVARIATGPDALFAIIERAARDNSVDLDRMQKLIDMHKDLKAGNARAEFDQAMSLAQKQMMAIRTNAKSDKGKYANYAALDKAIRPVYTEHGFSVSFDTDPGAPELTVRLVATVAHSGGHRERRQLDVPADGKGAKGGDVMTKTHATASAITYGKRYLSSMIWNLAVDNDDDGNAASSAAERFKVWTDAAIQELNALEKDKAALDKWYSENEKSLGRLKKNAPEQFERYQIAYTNAAERAGIKNEEPKRGAAKKAKEPEAPAHDPKTAEIKEPETVGEILDRKPPVTDVVDQNEPIEFDDFPTTRPFIDWSSGWLADPNRTPAQARQWEAFYREKMGKLNAESKIKWVIDGLADLMVQFNLILAKEQPE